MSSVREATRTICLNDDVITHDVPLDEGCYLWHQLPQRCDGETEGPIFHMMKDPFVFGRETRSLTARAGQTARN